MTDGEVRVLHAAHRDAGMAVVRWGSAPMPVDESGRARAVSGALAKAGIRERRVVVCLPARSVVVKQVKLPPAAQDQLAQLVQYEAQRHLPLPVEQLAPGFQVLRRENGGTAEPGQQVLMAIARRPDLMRLEKALVAEGITVEGYGIDALSVTDAYLNGAEANGTARLVLAPEAEGVHAQVVHGRDLLLSRYLTGKGEEWAPELRRSLAAFGLDRPGTHIGEAVLLGEGDEAEVSRAVGLAVRRAAGSQVPELPPGWGAVAGLASQWLGIGSHGVRIPAQGWEASDGRQGASLVVAGLVAAVLAVTALVVWQVARQSSQQRETRLAITEAKQIAREQKLLDALVKKRDRLRAQADAVGLSSGRMPPLEVLREVANRAPSEVWLTRLTYQPGRPLQIEGTTRNPAQVTLYLRSLEKVGAFSGAELGGMQSAEQEKVPVTHFRIQCVLADAPARTEAP